MALSLSRNAKFVVTDGTNTPQEIGILDGFSFSQATSTQNVTLNEAGTAPRRGQTIFNTALDPVDWSLTTYVRPYNHVDGGVTTSTAVEKILWNSLVSGEADTGVTVGLDSGSMLVDFGSSNTNNLLELTGYIVFESGSEEIFQLNNMVVNSASIDFDIDGIAQISWSGFATSVVSTNAATTAYNDLVSAVAGIQPIPSDADFILNRLSTVDISGQGVSGSIALTGGNITIDNGVSYVTPETLGTINSPIGHQTGTRAISGSLSCYLEGTGKDVYDALLADINTGALGDITNEYNIGINIGGGTAPKVSFSIVQAHLELPAIDTADVMGITMNFTGLESAFGTGNNEATIVYTPSQ